MTARNLLVIVIPALAFTSHPTDARAQTLDCSTIQGASEYGTDISLCRMPDQSTLRCTQDKGGLSYCKVEHPDGFVSAAPAASVGPVTQMIALIAEARWKHRQSRAEKDLRSATELNLKSFVLLTDLSALSKSAASSASSQKSESVDAILTESGRLAEFARDQLTANDFMAAIQPKDWRLGAHPELFRQLHGLALESACSVHQMGRVSLTFLESKINTLPANAIPSDFRQALLALRTDEESFDVDCSSKEALKLMGKHGKR